MDSMSSDVKLVLILLNSKRKTQSEGSVKLWKGELGEFDYRYISSVGRFNKDNLHL